jgi:hypothetical protein
LLDQKRLQEVRFRTDFGRTARLCEGYGLHVRPT